MDTKVFDTHKIQELINYRSPVLFILNSDKLWKAHPHLLELLSSEEVERSEQYVLESRKKSFIVTRAFLRTLISQLYNVDTQSIRIDETKKPYFVDFEHLDFSISHSAEQVLIGFCLDFKIGVDVEKKNKNNIPDRVLADQEKRLYTSISNQYDKDEYITKCWVQKEAVLKAIGQGLAIPPKSIDTTSFTSSINMFGDNFYVHQMELPEAEMACACTAQGEPRVIKVPLNYSPLIVD